MLLGILLLFLGSIIASYCPNFIAWLTCSIRTKIYFILCVYNVHNAYTSKLRTALSPANLSVVTCDSRGVTCKLVPRSITVCSMGPSVSWGVKITGLCRPLPLPVGDCRRRLAALRGLLHSAARRQNFLTRTVCGINNRPNYLVERYLACLKINMKHPNNVCVETCRLRPAT